MARNKGTFGFAANFLVKMQEALDPRVVVTRKADLIAKDTWPYDGDALYVYAGMIVGVVEEQAAYMLLDVEKTLLEDYSGWYRLDGGSAVEVIDNLESDSSTSALSAKQGKVLMNEVSTLEGKLAGIYTYKGTVAAFTGLPTTDLTIGDVYNVLEAYAGNAAGSNYAWTGTEWDALGGTINLANYYTKGEVDANLLSLSKIANTAEGKASTAITRVLANEASINSLSQSLGELNEVINGNETEKGVVESLSEIENDYAFLEPRVTQNEKDIKDLKVLNDGVNVPGSVDYKISQAFKWVNV